MSILLWESPPALNIISLLSIHLGVLTWVAVATWPPARGRICHWAPHSAFMYTLKTDTEQPSGQTNIIVCTLLLALDWDRYNSN